MTSSSTESREIRKFGAIALCVFGLLFGVGLWRERVFVTIFFGILAFLGLLFLIMPAPLKPVYEAWLRISHLIGKLSTGLMLATAYYLVITPTAMVKRLFGGRPLPMVPDRTASSYWVGRSEPAQPRERFQKRY